MKNLEVSTQELIILLTLLRAEVEGLEKRDNPVLREYTRGYEQECRDLLARIVLLANGGEGESNGSSNST